MDVWDHEGGAAFAEYKTFRLGNEKTAFKLHVGKYSGNAGTEARNMKHHHFEFKAIIKQTVYHK